MDTTKKIVAIVLVAVMSFAFGLAGGFLADGIKETYGLKHGGKTSGQEYQGLTDGETIHIGNSSITRDEDGNIIINAVTDYTLAEGIAVKVMPSVVSVTTTYEESFNYFGFGFGRDFTQESSCVGTGFIISENGYIITNSHVVNDGDYKRIIISLYGGEDMEGTVLWNDSTLDLAVVKIDKTGLSAAELGDSDLINLGSYAAAIGNPLGLTFERSITQGIISGLDRTITVSSSSSLSGTTMEGLIQTDAAINSGNSGGPLLNAKGEVIGINSAKASSGESMGFAIPINVAKPIIAQIIETGSFERVYLGITAIGIEQQASVSKDALEEYYGSSRGIYIASVTKGGGADKAGLKEGDVILTVDGTPVGTMNKMYSVLVSFKAGESVNITYLRDGAERQASVVLMTSAQLEAIAE